MKAAARVPGVEKTNLYAQVKAIIARETAVARTQQQIRRIRVRPRPTPPQPDWSAA